MLDLAIASLTIWSDAAVATEELKSGSNSTSCHDAEVAVISAAVTAAVLSLTEYPNLPAPYNPPLASALDAEVLP